MLKNWDVYSKMLSEYNSQDAVGSAMEEAQKTANSWEGQLNKLSNTWTKFVKNFVDTDFVKTGISGVSSFIDILDKLIDKFGILGGVITPIVATVMTVKNKGITDIFNSFKSSEKYKSIETGLFGTSKVLSTEDVASLKTYNELLKQGKSSTEAFDIALGNSNNTVKQMAINASGSAVKLQTMTIAERAAATGAKLLGGALKIGAGLLVGGLISVAIGWIEKIVDKYTNAQEHIQEFANSFSDSMQSAKEEQKAVYDLTNQYIKAVASTNDLTSSKKDLQAIQDTLINKYGDEAKGIDLVNGKISEQITGLIKLKREQAKKSIEDISITDPNNQDNKISGEMAYKTAKKYLEQTGTIIKDTDTGFAVLADDNVQAIASSNVYNKKDFAGLLSKYNDKIGYGNMGLLYFGGTLKEQIDTMTGVYDELFKKWEKLDLDSKQQKWLSDFATQISALKSEYDGLNSAVQEYETLQKTIKENDNSETTEKALNKLNDLKNSYIDAMNNGNYSNMDNYYNQLIQEKTNLEKQFKNNEDILQVIQDFFNALPTKINTDVFDITQFSEDIDNLQTKIKSLKETLSKLKDGSITQDELIDFTQEYGLTEYINDLPELQKQIEKLLKTSPDDLINKLSELRDNVDETDAEKITGLIFVLRQLGDTSESVDSVSESIQRLEDEKSIQRLEDEISAIDEQLSELNDEKKSLEDTISTIESNNSNIVSAYEYQVDKVINKLQDEVDVHQRIVDKYEAKNELLEDENDKLQDQADIIQEILNNYDTSSNVVQNFIDKQIDSLEERKSKIQEENDSLNETINLEEKLNNLRNAKRKRVRIYNEQGGWQLGEDTSAVQSAEKEYRDAVTDKKTSDIDKQIEGWRNYAQQWSDTVDNINNKQDELTANEILGSNWREKITNKDIGILKKFGSEYINYKNKLENNINAKIKKNEADIKKNEEVIKAENKVIKSKNAVIDKWQEYKNKLSDFVDETSKKSNEYINSLSNVTLSEKSSYSDRTNFFNDYKQALVNGYKEISKAKAQLNDVENTIGSLENDKKNKENQKSELENQQKNGTTTTQKQYKLVNTKTGSIVGTSENKESLEKAKADLDKTLVEKTIRKQFANVPEPTRSKAIKSLIDKYTADDKAIEEYLKLYKLNNKYVIKSYSTGGTVDYTGLANVHGSKSNSEVIFNSAQAKKLYDFIANTGNLSEVIGRQVAQDLGNKTINNIVNNNDKADNSKTNITIRVDKIVTPNANDFMNQMTNLIRQSNRNRMVGK